MSRSEWYGILDAVPRVALVLHPHGAVAAPYRRWRPWSGGYELLVLVTCPCGARRARTRRGRPCGRGRGSRAGLACGASQPVERVVGQLVGDVALLRNLLAVDVQAVLRGQVGALAAEADPVVEARLRLVAFAAHVPLADEGGLVAGLLQVLREEASSPAEWRCCCRRCDGGGRTAPVRMEARLGLHSAVVTNAFWKVAAFASHAVHVAAFPATPGL